MPVRMLFEQTQVGGVEKLRLILASQEAHLAQVIGR